MRNAAAAVGTPSAAQAAVGGQSDFDRVRDEILALATGRATSFSQVIGLTDVEESYFFSDAGVIIRVLRAPGTIAATTPSHLQIYDLNGVQLGAHTKVLETSNSFFMRKFSPQFNRSECYELAERPSFIAKPNISSFFEIVPRRHFHLGV
jgi:hypothetical protein